MLASAAGVNIVSLATIMGPTMPQGFDLSSFLPYRLAVLAERVSRRLAEDYGRSHGLSVAEWRGAGPLARAGRVAVRRWRAPAPQSAQFGGGGGAEIFFTSAPPPNA